MRLALLLTAVLTGTALALPASVTVKSGDTLFRIATRYGLSVSQLRALNGLKGDTIRVGQTLRLASAAPKPRGSTAAGRYTVRAGDSLAAIAARAGTSVAALQAANGLRSSVIRPGQVLQVPPPGPARPVRRPTTEVRLIYSYVRVGLRDTPETLARRYHTTPDALRRLNGLGSRSHMVPGLKLLVPLRLPVPIPPPATGRALTFKALKPLNVPVQLVRVDLRHRDVLVAPVLPRAGLSFGVGARVSQLAQRSGARALINGSYFHPQTYAPAGDLVMQGRMLTWGRIPMALAITPDNRATIRASTTPLLLRPLDATWRGMETVVATGPRIVSGGRLFTDYSRVFRDPAVFGRAARSAIGLSSNRDLVLVSTRARLTATEMGKIMTRLGVKDALLLDGGSSAGLAWNGRAVADSIRRVSYGIGVFTGYTGRRYAR
ncbi:LysM peptidoglycan-binding domain-containing protein [Deinococcus hohokamensis]|uniref:LysM peptidoglycan-binding domain-containing protein n=1 Tax=Deinococcus hohokamensis TaxID=309883 RepID=A0ABV9I4P8_9DEIO